MATPGLGPAATAPESESTNPLIGVFFSPGAAMDALARKPRFWLALAVVTLIGIVVMTVAYQRGVMEHGIRQKMETGGQMDRLPADQRERALEQGAKWGSYIAMGGSVVGPALALAMTSGVLLLLSKLALGGRGSFQQMMAVVSHAWLPLSVHGLLSIPIYLAKEPDTIDFENPLPVANLGFLFSSTDQAKLYRLGSSIDLFSFWVMVLLVIGISRLTGRSKGAAAAVVAAPWALVVAIRALTA